MKEGFLAHPADQERDVQAETKSDEEKKGNKRTADTRTRARSVIRNEIITAIKQTICSLIAHLQVKASTLTTRRTPGVCGCVCAREKAVIRLKFSAPSTNLVNW